MSVKKLTVMILDDKNKACRGVFDGSGACIQGDESVRELAAAVLASSPAPEAPTPDVDAGFDDSDVVSTEEG